MSERETETLVDAIAAAVRSVDGVAGLHGGTLGEAATYLPGRRVPGVRITPDGTEIHVGLRLGAPIRETAAAVRRAVATLVPGRVDVTVEDVVDDIDDDPSGAEEAGATGASRATS